MPKIKTNIIYPVFLPFLGCPFKCVYCNQNVISSSIISDIKIEPIISFIEKHKNKQKEIAFYGGSFTALPKNEISALFNKLNPYINETTWFRISTRPDFINTDILDFLKDNRVNTIELGVQSFCNNSLIKTKRGYSGEMAEKSCKLVIDYGFNLSIQFLIGMPGELKESIDENINKLIKLKPDFVRLYPLLVLKDTELECLYKNGEYSPISLEDAVLICGKYLKICQENNIKVIKMGLHSDISKDSILAGPFHDRFAELVYEKCNCF